MHTNSKSSGWSRPSKSSPSYHLAVSLAHPHNFRISTSISEAQCRTVFVTAAIRNLIVLSEQLRLDDKVANHHRHVPGIFSLTLSAA